MKTLKVNEIFHSLQGEGCCSGKPAVFLRLANCNLKCDFCDTEFISYKEMSYEEILNKILEYDCKFLVITGGEPLLQLNENVEFISFIKKRIFLIAIETNGSIKPAFNNFDILSISPKVAEHVLVKNFENFIKLNRINYKIIFELKYLIHENSNIPQPLLKTNYRYLSPIFNGDQPNKKNIDRCIQLLKEQKYSYPTEFKLSLQLHKIIGIL